MQIAPLGLFMPDLYERIFDPDYIPPDAEREFDPNKVGLWTPTSEEEFEEMAAAWGDLGGELDFSGVFQTPDLGEGAPPIPQAPPPSPIWQP